MAVYLRIHRVRKKRKSVVSHYNFKETTVLRMLSFTDKIRRRLQLRFDIDATPLDTYSTQFDGRSNVIRRRTAVESKWNGCCDHRLTMM